MDVIKLANAADSETRLNYFINLLDIKDKHIDGLERQVDRLLDVIRILVKEIEKKEND